MEEPDDGGDPACWLNLVCPRCGELGGHLAGCPLARLGEGVGAAWQVPPVETGPPAAAGDDPPGDR